MNESGPKPSGSEPGDPQLSGTDRASPAAPRFLAARIALFFAASFLLVGTMMPYFPVWLDWKGLSAAEIARYTGPLRAVAERAFERDSARVKATGILNQMVNRLPKSSTAGIEALASLREQTAGKGVAAEMQPYITRAVENCRETLRVGMMPDLRSCLAYQHDYLAGENTTNGWQAMNPGS